MGFLTPVWNYVDALLPAAAQQDALTTARYRAFIAPRLIASLLAFACLPIYVVVRGVPSALEFAVFAWMATPVLIVYFLSKTALYEAAHLLSSMSLASAAGLVAFHSGGMTPFAAVWLVVAPLEAAQAGSRRIVLVASLISLSALVLLGWGTSIPSTGSGSQGAVAVLSLALVLLYAISLAFGTVYLLHAASRLLRDQERRYLLLARNMVDVIVHHDQSGAVQFVSPAVDVLFGIPAGDLKGHGLFDRVHVTDRPAFLTALSDAGNLAVERTLELRIRRDVGADRPGQYIWVDMCCRPHNDIGKGRHREVVSILRDANERKSQEQSIEAARYESDRAGDAKSQFIATVSHELRTPLNAIIGFSEIIMINASDLSPARRSEYARLINTSGQHLLALVNGILDASKLEAGHFHIIPESFAPGLIIEDCANLLAMKAREAGIELKVHLDRSLPDIAADKRAFNQILINLVSNAVKFNRRGGYVTISASREGQRFILSVEDTGVGIAEAELPRLGEAFFQATTSYNRHCEGSGLGLSIVKGLVKLHGGAIDITSRIGKGTRVRVWLPLGQPLHAARAPARAVETLSTDVQSATKNRMKKSA